jgi:hypothetical protein
MRKLIFAFIIAITATTVSAMAAPFILSTNGLADNAMMPKEDGYDKTSATGLPCSGTNHAPGFSWANPPAGTQSFAVLMFDPDGRAGLGVSHWVLYNVPGTVLSIPTADIAANKYTVGRGTGDLVSYRGPCPPAGDAPHHYVVTIYALDLPPTLPVGLDRDGVFKAMTGHIKGATTTIMRYQTPG